MSEIYKNMVLRTDGLENEDKINLIRIIWFSGNLAYYVNLQGDSSMPKVIGYDELKMKIELGLFRENKDPFAIVVNDEDISDVYKEIRDKSYEIVKCLWLEENLEILYKAKRAELIKSVADKFNMPELKVKRIMSRFWQRGMVKNALLPDFKNSGAWGKSRKISDKKRGRPRKIPISDEYVRGINVDEKIEGIMDKAINEFYKTSKKKSLQESYYLMLKKYFSDVVFINGKQEILVWDSNKIPTYPQFYYWYRKKFDFKKVFISRYSEKEFNQKYRELLGNTNMEAFGPGSKYQIDATVADVYLVSSLNTNLVIGRPIVYGVIDVYSRMITGIYVGLEGPSWIGAMMALDNAFSNKVSFCEKYGIHITNEQWPCEYLPETILADRGEFEGYNPESLINNLNVTVQNTSPYRGDLKGIVERRFRTINEKIKHMAPGAIQKAYRVRGDVDYRLDATLNMNEFTKIILHLVLQYNSSIIDKMTLEKGLIKNNVLSKPIDIWKWGIENRKGAFVKREPDIVRLNLLPKANVTVSRQGIKFQGAFYSAAEIVKKGWFINRNKTKIEVAYDPRNMNFLYIPNDGENGFIKCYMLDKSEAMKDLDYEEIIFQNEIRLDMKKVQVDNKNKLVAMTDNEIEKVIASAQARIKNSSNLKSLKDIKQNRVKEKELKRTIESFELGKNEIIKGKISNFERSDERIIISNTSRSSKLDKLRQKRDEKLGKK